jgi:hypothetical protein
MPEFTDLVVWTNDVPGLVDEALAKGYTGWLKQDEDGDYTLGGDRTPLIVKWPEAIALIRVSDVAALGGFTKLQVLGWYEGDSFVASSDTAQAKYDSLYPRTPYYNSLTGNMDVPPERIGSFG